MEIELIKHEVEDLLQKMGFGDVVGSIEIHQGATSRVSVSIHTDAYMLIGEHGATLAALEYIVKRILRKKYTENQDSSESIYTDGKFDASQKPSFLGFTLDINDYRMRRLEELKQDVKTAAREVRLYRKEVPLRFMSPFERRIVHLLLAEYPDITTESIGQEPSRRVVIKPYP